MTATTALDPVHHVAVSVRDVKEAVAWYQSRFACRVSYQDDTWAMLEFANIKLALVVPSQQQGRPVGVGGVRQHQAALGRPEPPPAAPGLRQPRGREVRPPQGPPRRHPLLLRHRPGR